MHVYFIGLLFGGLTIVRFYSDVLMAICWLGKFLLFCCNIGYLHDSQTKIWIRYYYIVRRKVCKSERNITARGGDDISAKFQALKSEVIFSPSFAHKSLT